MYAKSEKIKKLIPLLCVLLLILCLAGCNGNGENTITVAACTTPHSDILRQCADILAEDGYTLKVVETDDYITPNLSTESGEVDANYFQHTPYLDEFNAKQETHIISVAKIHYEPYAIYAGTQSELSALPRGAKIAVPNDPTNEARALRLLESQGLIKLKEDAGLKANKNDIIENSKNFDIVEMEASVIPNALGEVAVAVINGNYALEAGLSVSDALAVEDASSTAAQTYANVLAVKQGNEENAAVKALAAALGSEEIKNYINTTYGGSAVAIE